MLVIVPHFKSLKRTKWALNNFNFSTHISEKVYIRLSTGTKLWVHNTNKATKNPNETFNEFK